MFELMNKMLDCPPLYRETEVAFWDDEHISKQMLKAHLDPECSGASRRLSFINKSVSWIKETVPPMKYPLLLDVGCGPGIYAEQFAQVGFQVTGVDFSKRSIHHAQGSAKNKNLNISYFYQNYLDLKLEKEFDFATMIYCDYGALSTENRKIILENVYKHLKPGGKFLFDVFSLEHFEQFQEKKTWEFHSQGGFWRADEHMELNASYKFPNGVTLEQIAVISNNKNAVYYLWNTCYTPELLKSEVEFAGFKVCGIFGDVSGQSLKSDSLTIALLLEK